MTPPAALPALVIFDCDGVLVDSEPLACAAAAEVLSAHGFAIGAEEVMLRYVGLSSASMLADLEARAGRAVPEAVRAAMREATMSRLASQLQPVPGVAKALAAWAGRRCVASSSDPQRLALSLARTGLAAFFGEHVFSATEVKRGKPAPDLFLHAAARMGVAPAHCVVVEDSVAGVTAAGAAGMRALGFVGAGHGTPALAQRLRDAGAATVFAAMAELPALLNAAG